MSRSNHVNYIFQIDIKYDIDKIHNKIKKDLIDLDMDFNLVFIAYNNTELKIVFKNNLTDEQELILTNLLLKYIHNNNNQHYD